MLLQLMQELMVFHLSDKDPLALIDVDMKRLKFAWQKMVIPSKDSVYLAALRSLENKYRDFSGSTAVS